MFSIAMSAQVAAPVNYGPWAPWARIRDGISLSDSGVNVTAFKALQIAAVDACVKIISCSLGSLRCYPYRYNGTAKKLDEDSDLYPLLTRGPTKFMTAMTWFVTMLRHLLLFSGNAYNIVERSNDGRIIGLWLQRPDRVTLRLTENGDLVYDIADDRGATKTYRREQVLHIPGEGYDGYLGFTPISVHRELFGEALALQAFGAAAYRNGVRPAGVFTHPAKLKPEPFQRLKDQVNQHAGSGNTGKAMILEEGMDWKPLGMNMHDAQYIEQQGFTDRQIAAVYRVPPKMIGDTEAESYGSAEADARWFVDQTLRQWAELIEQEIERQLMPEDPDACVRFDFSGLLRGDAVSRANANQIMRRNGVINANEWRESEDLNRIEGEGGDTYVIEGNMTTLDRVGQPTANTIDPDPGGDPGDETGNGEPAEAPYEETANKVTAAHRGVFLSELTRMAKIEATSRARAEKAEAASGVGACAKATNDHYLLLVSTLGPCADAYAVSLAAVLRKAADLPTVHQATRAAAHVAMNGQPTAEACVDEVMRTIAEAVA